MPALLATKHNTRIIRNEASDKDEFLLNQSNAVIKESYIATADKKYIILLGTTFRKEAQNSLLKVLEEPPMSITIPESDVGVTGILASIIKVLMKRIPNLRLCLKKRRIPSLKVLKAENLV